MGDLSPLEQEICDDIAGRRDEVVALASDLIGFDTTARETGDPAREEAALQAHLAERLRAVGAEVDVWEPDPAAMAGRPQMLPDLDFAGRPQLLARFAGSGAAGGRSLLLNGHIDAVSAEPLERWTSDPFRAEVRDGRLYGRGACDMKGGVASMVLAAEVLARRGVELAGDLLVATNTDEESSGAGGSALVEHGLHADAGIVTEPTGFATWVACRGSEYGVLTVPGRPGHAEVRQRHWRDGGAVNAIERATVVVDAVRSLRAKWAADPALRHPYVSPPDVLPTLARAGEWAVTYPSECTFTLAVVYVAAQVDADGGPSAVRAEVEAWLAEASRADDWLAEHPPRLEWQANGVTPMDIAPEEPIVGAMRAASAAVGRPSELSGLDSWYDGATYTLHAGIPSIAYGPRGLEPDGSSVAHTIDEYVPVEDLVVCAQGLAVAALRFCGTA